MMQGEAKLEEVIAMCVDISTDLLTGVWLFCLDIYVKRHIGNAVGTLNPANWQYTWSPAHLHACQNVWYCILMQVQ